VIGTRVSSRKMMTKRMMLVVEALDLCASLCFTSCTHSLAGIAGFWVVGDDFKAGKRIGVLEYLNIRKLF
jgi:hypothetical protein